MKFTKMHGLGNDYLYVQADAVPKDAAELAQRWSNRHTGVGSDGIIWILPSEVADCQMRIFNADGSEALMCGNGIRCVGKYVHDRGIVEPDARHIRVQTLSGIKTLALFVDDNNRVIKVSVEMGQARVGTPVHAQGVRCIPISVGNPHAVIFCDDAEGAPLATLGAALEHDPQFPGGVNVEFVQVISPVELRMRVWERGSGITMACGTGSCASVAAAVSQGYCAENTQVTVHLDGGDLHVVVSDDYHITMAGPAVFICDGETIDA